MPVEVWRTSTSGDDAWTTTASVTPAGVSVTLMVPSCPRNTRMLAWRSVSKPDSVAVIE